MRKFVFHLQKVLDYRRLVEEWARDAYLEARVKRLEAEAELEAIRARREEALRSDASTVAERLDLERYLQRLDDEEQAQRTVIAVLEEEEEKARLEWMERKRDAEALQKLHDRRRAEHELEEARRQQAELDEWAVMKRKDAA